MFFHSRNQSGLLCDICVMQGSGYVPVLRPGGYCDVAVVQVYICFYVAPQFINGHGLGGIGLPHIHVLLLGLVRQPVFKDITEAYVGGNTFRVYRV